MKRNKCHPSSINFLQFCYDTIYIIKNEVYNLDGRLYDYDEKIDEFSFSPLWFFDSLKILNRSTAVSYDHLDRFEFNWPQFDTFNVSMLQDRFSTIPRYLPDTILALDTQENLNFGFCSDPDVIRESLKRTYIWSEGRFILPLFAVRIFKKISVPYGYDIYDMSGQNSVNNVDREGLIEHLDPGETLSVISYEMYFKLKQEDS